jgi:hypothetical protein
MEVGTANPVSGQIRVKLEQDDTVPRCALVLSVYFSTGHKLNSPPIRLPKNVHVKRIYGKSYWHSLLAENKVAGDAVTSASQKKN